MIRIYAMLLLASCFTLATVLEPAFSRIRSKTDTSAGMLAALMGDSRRLFANHFFSMADAYFHSGFYPTIFDQAKAEQHSDLSEESHEQPSGAGHDEHHEETFLRPPKDWIERFGRHFYPTVHTHLSNGKQDEILPMLKISAMMDPTRIDTYVTAAYWLRTSLHKPDEAEQFLREGRRVNPDSYEILLELGRVYFYNKKDARVGGNIFSLAREKWLKQEADGQKPDPHAYEEILGELLRTDRQQGDLKAELSDLQALIKVSHSQETLEAYEKELKAKMANQK